MRVTWGAADIRPGTVVGKSDRTERWMIGYDPAVRWADDPNFAPKWVLVSLEDGMLARVGQTREQLAAHLNHSGDMPVVLFPLVEAQ